MLLFLKARVALLFIFLNAFIVCYSPFSNSNNFEEVLTEKEIKWLKAHPTIRVANEFDWHPFDFVEYGQPKGLAIDHIKLISQKIGLKIEFVNGYSWPELLELFKQRKIDVMPTLYFNEERAEHTLYTSPYYRAKLGIMVREDADFTIEDLYRVNVGIQEGNGSIKIVEQHLPKLKMELQPLNVDLVTHLATGRLDAIIGNPYVFYYHAKEEQISNIKLFDYIKMDSSQQLDTSFHVGVRKDWPILHSIIQKAMKTVTEEEFSIIERKWTNIRVDKVIDWLLFGQIVFAILALLAFLVWNNKKLKRMVANKTIELSALNASLENRIGERTNELLVATKALEKKELQQRDSIVSASHELRTPIAVMMAKIEAMRDGIRPLDQEQLTSLSSTVEHLAILVEDLYLLSLADVDALIDDKKSVKLAGVIDSAITAAQNQLSNNKLEIFTSIDGNIKVYGDARRLRQVIDNLLENCVRYTEDYGQIFIRLHQEQGSAVFVIADTGPGVDSDELLLLFDRFYLVDKSRSLQKGGTGLGLALVKAIVESHGGKIQAYQAPEGGLGIRIVLPFIHP